MEAIAIHEPTRESRAAATTLLRTCGSYEYVTFGYLALLNVLLVAFRDNLPRAWTYFALHCLIAAAILTICRAAQRWPRASLRFLRHWYPFALFIFFFEELHYLSHLVFPQWFDQVLVEFDFALVSAHPTVWLEQFASPLLNDFMQLGYLTYYFYTVVLCAVLYWRGELKAFRTTILCTAIAYITGYCIAIFFPTEGPYHTLASLQNVELTGGPVTALVNLIQRVGRVHGAAFPSLHVAGSMVAVLCAWLYRRRLFWIFLPCFLWMMAATVFSRYHYVADVLAGLVVGAIGYAVGRKVEDLAIDKQT